jgi:hypothetical protein
MRKNDKEIVSDTSYTLENRTISDVNKRHAENMSTTFFVCFYVILLA